MTQIRLLKPCIILGLACVLVACATKHNTGGTAVSSASPPPAAAGVTQSSIAPGSRKDFEVNVGDTVHFDYDRYELRGDAKSVLQRQAAWLARYPSVHITIEGHCDERGTRAYNLALGGRRAAAVEDYLASRGVSSLRMTTISYGKERPVCVESTESCWAQNRRAVTTITSGTAVTPGTAS